MSSEKCPSITRRLEDVIWIRDWSLEPRKPTTYRAQPSISGLKHTSAAAADMPMSLKHRHTRWNAKEPHPPVDLVRRTVITPGDWRVRRALQRRFILPHLAMCLKRVRNREFPVETLVLR